MSAAGDQSIRMVKQFSQISTWMTGIVCTVAVYYSTSAYAQDQPPAGLADSARDAVQVLGNEVVKGNLEFAFNHMYPRWQSRLVKQSGKREDLLQKVRQAGEQMVQNGISIIDFKADYPTSFFRVWPVRKDGTDEQSDAPENFVYQWLTFVPTQTTLRIIDRNNAETPIRRFVQSGFQVAITREDVSDWSFIDGSTLSVESLRSLFPSIPANIDSLNDPSTGKKVLPKPREAREIK